MNADTKHKSRVAAFNRLCSQLNFWQAILALIVFCISILIYFLLNESVYYPFCFGLGLIAVLLIIEYFIHRGKEQLPLSDLPGNKADIQQLIDHDSKKGRIYGFMTIIAVLACLMTVILSDQKTLLYSLIPITLFLGLKMVKALVLVFQAWILKDELGRIQ